MGSVSDYGSGLLQNGRSVGAIVLSGQRLSLHYSGLRSSLCECARCDRKILVGSLNEWKAEAFLEVLEQAGNRDESWRMAVVSGGEDTRREIEKLFHCRLQRLPASADAFRITREEIPCFEDLLFTRRGPGKMQ